MSSGDVAAWMQFLGAMLAIAFAWWQARRDGRVREAEARASAEAERMQRIINYRIAEDLFRIVVRQQFDAAVAIMNDRGSNFFNGDIISYIDATLKKLDDIILALLPNSNCAIDVQQMRHYAYASRAQVVMAGEVHGVAEKSACLKSLLNNLSTHIDYAFIDRGDEGPRVDKDHEIRARWRWRKGINPGGLREAYRIAKLKFPKSGNKRAPSDEAVEAL
ncbi:hypothetical protein LGR54_16430 [Ancylobacter sp. Lp-2]|uniref:hypothetical protein n=1 Tax=Ancylobacter sp. Lp-2 TaxID=2881339 RepID=UPI001E38B97B|nr:hypothetical protein [Ancylobacter sp. Lp-2]MCB4770204.1 hypothetical protein [Ancylobacter sp. Lp-2]